VRRLRYADVSTGALRGMLATLTLLDVLPAQRGAIALELAVREWIDAVEVAAESPASCVWTERGGLS
jgi:hypothetical protein